MECRRLKLRDFRNYIEKEYTFSSHINFIHGPNGGGKTSILEAVYFLCLTKSFKTNDEIVAIRWDQEYFDIEGDFFKSTNEKDLIRMVAHRTDGKSLLVNRKRLDRFSEWIGKYPSVSSSPQDSEIITGSGSIRRRWLDMALSQSHPSYLFDLQDYRTAVRQRNALLSELSVSPEHLEVWDRKLATLGARIVETRLEFVDVFGPSVSQKYSDISSSDEKILLNYRASFEFEKNEIEKSLLETIRKNRAREIQRQSSLYGPHKDDVVFLLNEHPMRDAGSMGQIKTLMLALKLAEFEFIRDRIEASPILLLDDVFSELDESRQYHLLECLTTAGQVFITTTEADHEFQIQKEILKIKIE